MQDTDLNASEGSLVSRLVKGQYGRSEIIFLLRRFNERCFALASIAEKRPNDVPLESILRCLAKPERNHVSHILSRREYWRKVIKDENRIQ